ncbi:MAG: hypothetical protein EHM42_13865, partial [Planctomycetaceae bacterium]
MNADDLFPSSRVAGVGTRNQPLQVVIVPPAKSFWGWLRAAVGPLVLLASIGANVWMYGQYRQY